MTVQPMFAWRVAGAAMPLAILLPVLAGLLGVLLPALGFHPALGLFNLSLDPLTGLLGDPSFPRALLTTLISAVGASLLAVSGAFAFCAVMHTSPWFVRLRAVLAAALSLPHASFAVGFAFLVAPSGFVARLLSPQLTGWQVPPDIVTTGDPLALCLLLALALKEVLFLILMIIAVLGQIPVEASLRTAQSFGYGPVRAWLAVIFPLVYARIRLPIYAVIAASIGSVDLALVLGPSAPPTLAVLILRWFSDFDLALQLRAAAGALVLLTVTVVVIAAWRLCERLLAPFGQKWLCSGVRRGAAEPIAQSLGIGLAGLSIAVSLCTAFLLLIWSFAYQWPWPGALPVRWTSANWTQLVPALLPVMGQTIVLAAASAVLSLTLVIAALEAEAEVTPRWLPALVYVPLLVPQIGILFGVQVFWIALGWDGSWPALIWTHMLFVMPYLFLSLRLPFAKLDPRLTQTARSLGKSRFETLVQVKLPLLLRPVLIALAIGFAISVSLYLPTIVAGAGRISTLATETIALASGGDRRTLGVIAITLAILPFIALLAAFLISAAAAKHRRGLGA